MSHKDKTRFIHDVPTMETDVDVKRPFKLEQEEMRRFVRIEITSPMSLNKIRDTLGHFWPDGEPHTVNGHILNISAGGVLVELDQQVDEGDIVAMRFTLQGMEKLEWVLGLVKRSDFDDSAYLVGIEFVSRESLVDLLTRGQMELLPDRLHDFNESIRLMLNRFVRRRQLAGRDGESYERD